LDVYADLFDADMDTVADRLDSAIWPRITEGETMTKPVPLEERAAILDNELVRLLRHGGRSSPALAHRR
jgi:hypothetical protein